MRDERDWSYHSDRSNADNTFLSLAREINRSEAMIGNHVHVDLTNKGPYTKACH